MNNRFVTTSFSFEGYRIVEHLGVVRGIIVRSRSIVGNIIAGFEMLFGGKIAMYTQLCERTRQESFDLMVEHAMEKGANAIIGMRYDANEVAAGVTEVLCYGTAVRVEKE
ncbi:MAG: YbjQ family protein [Desulfovibrio sp.]|nr:YbjQ family protein [Desulfovibrio sp.]MBI4959313.1 YbjQ family protein [Desulfovibrio sp.]